MPLTPPYLDQNVDVLEMNEAFEEVDGSFKFTGTLIVYRAGNNMRHAISKARYFSPSEVRAEHLINDILIPVSAYSPPFSSQFTRAPGTLPRDIYIKKPQLISYDRVQQGSELPNHIADSILREIEICEILKRHPHPNITAYLGCQVSDGRITGICFAKYDCTLMQRANPGSFMKRKSRTVLRKTEDYSRILEGVESGIRYLHSLGLVHNDINPSNIMLDGDVPIIIDFGSCRRVGESLEDVGRTYEWYDENVQLSVPKNDLDALEEIRIWLGDDSNVFQFDE
ncbi:Mitogen-activated protein kinase 8 [Ilyonectria robusta]